MDKPPNKFLKVLYLRNQSNVSCEDLLSKTYCGALVQLLCTSKAVKIVFVSYWLLEAVLPLRHDSVLVRNPIPNSHEK